MVSTSFIVSGFFSRTAEIASPCGNILEYQEERTPEGSSDIIEYAEPKGGPQNKPYKDMSDPNALEQDGNIQRQGEYPEDYQNAVPPEEFPVSTDPEYGADKRDLSVDTKTDLNNPDPFGQRNGPTEPIGYPDDYYAEPGSYSNVSVYASNKNATQGEIMGKNIIVNKIVLAALDKGFYEEKYLETGRIRLASINDLFSFDRVEGSDNLIHKASHDLWKIIQEDDGGFVIEKTFNDEKEPVRD